MAEVTTITQVTQLGVEATPGTSVAADKRMQMKIEPSASIDITMYAPAGGKYNTLSALGKDFTEASFSGVANYNELAYIASSILAYSAPTQVNPPTGTAYQWTFTPSQFSEDSIKTYTVETGSSVRAWRFVYGLVTEWSYSIDREKFEISGSMIGRKLEDGITLTANPTMISLVPILPTGVSIYLDNTSGGLGTTKLTRVISAEFSISDRFSPVWPLDAALDSFAVHIETQPKAQLTLTLEADSNGMALLSAARNGDKRFIRIKAEGPTIEGTTKYLFQHDMCCLVSEVGDFSDEDGLWAIQYTFDVVYDDGWGKAHTLQLINTLSAL